MRKNFLLIPAFLFFLSNTTSAQVYHPMAGGSFTQNWSTTTLITTNDVWTGVSSIIGFLGQDITTATGTDPQSLTGVSELSNYIDVIANQ